MIDADIKIRDPYKTSRAMYVIIALFEYFVSILTTGAYLAKLTTTMGISDSVTALIGTLASLAGSFQIISITLAHKTPVKKWIIPIEFFAHILLSALYLVPFLALGSSSAGIIVFVIFLVANALKHIATPIRTTWFQNLVEPKKRGMFTAVLQAVSLVGAMVFTLVMSRIIDVFESRGNMQGAFIIITVIILSLTTLDVLAHIFAKEKPTEKHKNASPLGEVKHLLKNKKYTSLIFIHCIFGIVNSIACAFLGTYHIGELGFSMTFISIVDVFKNLLMMVAMFYFGRFSMRRGNLPLLRLGYLAYAISYVFIVFTTPANGKVMYIFYLLILIVASASTSIGNNMIYSITDISERTSAIALNTIISGITAFLTTLAATPIFNYIKETRGSVIFGRTIYAQQIFGAVSTVLGIGLVIFVCTRFTRVVKATPDPEEE